MGYTVEFLNEKQIYDTFGPNGIHAYALDPTTGKAVISDDTQMTLFTLSSLYWASRRTSMRGVSTTPENYAVYGYIGWLQTQQAHYSAEAAISEEMLYGFVRAASYLLWDNPELYQRRAPGATCLSALKIRMEQMQTCKTLDFIASKINNSKGCGGVMRLAPLALALPRTSKMSLHLYGAQLAAITHSHSLGYMPAAVLVDIIASILCADSDTSLKQIIENARDTALSIFHDDPHIGTLKNIIDLAITLSENEADDLDNIHRLGEGWVAEEALAIAIYCSLKYRNDFSQAIICAVNHKGDSDSTGSITGNILGALLGYDKIDPKWKLDLQLHDLILDCADKLNAEYHPNRA